MNINISINCDSDSNQEFKANNLHDDLLDCVDKLLKNPTSKNLNIANELLDLVTDIYNSED